MQRLVASMRQRLRLIVIILLSPILVWAFLPETFDRQRVLILFSIALWIEIVLAISLYAPSKVDVFKHQAKTEDSGPIFILIFEIFIVVLCFGLAIPEIAELRKAKYGLPHAQTALATSTIVGTWLLLHLAFAIHYAKHYYASEEQKTCITFPGDQEPDFWDFVYFAFTIGIALQTSDVTIRSRLIRRTVLAHTFFSFFYNVVILAIAVNVAADLI